MNAEEYITELLEKGRAAQRIFEQFDQAQVDACVRAVGKVIYDHAEELARMAVDESGMGVYEDKIAKNRNKPKATWYRLKGVKSRGILNYDEETGIAEVAKPIGVIGCITPSTNPTMTPVHNAMIALKGGNAMIVCPHPGTKKTTTVSVEYMRQALAEVGAPADLLQVIPEPTIAISGEVMHRCDTTVATGGPSMVRAAYSSGRPAFGVGAGNVQSLVDDDVDLQEAAKKIAKSRSNDNGVLCTCEQFVHIPASKLEEMAKALVAAGAAYITDDNKIAALRETVFPDGALNKKVVGKDAVYIAAMAGLEVPENTKLLLVPVTKCGKEEFFGKEKLCPVLAICPYEGWDEAVSHALANLLMDGTGHSCVLHSNNEEHVKCAAERLPVSRFGVNMIGSSGLGGGLDNGLNPTASLSCGSWGGNSISENLWWKHLVNISRIAYVIPNAKIPTDEEIWAE